MIVVTGGAGFIGSQLVKALNERGRTDIIVVDNLEQGEKHLNLNACEIEDLIHEEEFIMTIDDYRSDLEIIFHQGACTDTVENDGHYMMETNYEYTRDLWKWCRESGTRLIYASSAAVYGNGDNGFQVDPKCEDPLNVYGYSKLLTDRWLRRQNAFAGEVQCAGLRYFNVYGPQENHKGRMASVIYQFERQWRENGKIKLFKGSETFLRDFVFVSDVIAVNLFLMDHPEASGIFNVGTGDARSFADMAEAFCQDREGAEIEWVEFPADLAGRYQKYTCADLTELRQAGFAQDFTSLQQGVKEYTEWLKDRSL